MGKVLASVLACFMAFGCALPRSGDSSRALLPLAVEYAPARDVAGPVRLRVGEPLAVRPYLVNVGRSPVRVLHGVRLFVLEARRIGSLDTTGRAELSFPPAGSWGEVRMLEYPNPHAVYILPQILAVLGPGKRYAPARGLGEDDHTVRFEEPGDYNIRVCADLDNEIGGEYGPQHLRICARRDIGVMVR